MKKRVIITPWGSDINYMGYLKKLILKILKKKLISKDGEILKIILCIR
jgi:hypothetical protein